MGTLKGKRSVSVTSFGLLMAVAHESLLKEDEDHRAAGRELVPTTRVRFGTAKSMAFSFVWRSKGREPNGLVEQHALRIILGGKRPGSTRSASFRVKAVAARGGQ